MRSMVEGAEGGRSPRLPSPRIPAQAGIQARKHKEHDRRTRSTSWPVARGEERRRRDRDANNVPAIHAMSRATNTNEHRAD